MNDPTKVPDPGLTLSEAINGMGGIRHLLNTSHKDDAVLESVWQKLCAVAFEHGAAHPDQLAAVEAEVALQGQFRSEQ